MAYVLGAPLKYRDRAAYQRTLGRRCKTPDPLERAVDFQYQILDRQINKAMGLLTYDALLFAAVSAFRGVTGSSSVLITAGSLLALLSCLPLLTFFFVTWDPPGSFRSARADFRTACRTTYRRSYVLTFSMILSVCATLLTIWVVGAQPLQSS